ncbi:MAG TPA: PAS domain S-box protein, partial [Actinomycetota bacterium]|nr:PAS domain S-box protein [Actinomycetota bacterium]
MVQLLSTEQSILDQIQVAVIVTDLDGVITRWNRQAEQLYGWTAQEAVGRSALELLVPPTEVLRGEAIMRDLSTQSSWDGEFTLRRKDGSSIVVHASDSVLLDDSGRPVGIVGISFDVTDRRRAEERLAVQYGVTQALAEAGTLAEAAPRVLQALCETTAWQVGVLWALDRDAGALRPIEVMACEPGHEAFVTKTRQLEFALGAGLPGQVYETGATLWAPDFVDSPDYPRAAAAGTSGLRSALAFPIRQGEEVLGILEFLGPEIPEPDEELLRMLEGIGAQIGQFIERVEAEAERGRTDARRRAILEASLDCIVAMDHRGVITEFNRAAELTFGYAREEVIGKELAEQLIPPALQDAHREGLARYLAGGGGAMLGHRTELTARRKDGTEFPVEIAITRVDLPGPALFKGAIRDITERKRRESELARALAEEQAARAQVESAQRRLAFLAEAGVLLASARDFSSALEALGRLAVTLLADVCLIDVLDEDGELQRLVAVHADPEKESLTSELQGRYPPRRGGPHPAARVVQTGRSEFSPDMTDEFLRETTRNDEHFRITKQLGMTSYVCVPLVAGERILGTITLVSTQRARRFGPADVTLAEELARRTATTLETFRLLEAEQRARRRAERAAERTAALQSITAAMSEALSSQEVTRAVLDQAVAQLAADSGAIGLVTPDGTQIETVHARGYPP